jgi:hypothetical protein
VYENSDSDSDDDELLATVYADYKRLLKEKKLKGAPPAKPAVVGIKFV